MVAGGPRLAWLEAIRARHPISLHGVRCRSPLTPRPIRHICAGSAALVDRVRARAGVRASRLVDLARRVSSRPAAVSAHRRGARPRSPTTSAARRMPSAGASRSRIRRTICASTATHGTRSSSSPSSRAAPAAACCSTSTTCSSRRATSALGRGLPRSLSRRARDGDPSRRSLRATPRSGEALLDRLARRAGRTRRSGRCIERLIARIGPRPTLIERDDNLPGVRRRCSPSASAPRRCSRAAAAGRMTGVQSIGMTRARSGPAVPGRSSRARCSSRTRGASSARDRAPRGAAGVRGLPQHRDEGLHRCAAGQLSLVARLVGEEWFRAAARSTCGRVRRATRRSSTTATGSPASSPGSRRPPSCPTCRRRTSRSVLDRGARRTRRSAGRCRGGGRAWRPRRWRTSCSRRIASARWALVR